MSEFKFQDPKEFNRVLNSLTENYVSDNQRKVVEKDSQADGRKESIVKLLSECTLISEIKNYFLMLSKSDYGKHVEFYSHDGVTYTPEDILLFIKRYENGQNKNDIPHIPIEGTDLQKKIVEGYELEVQKIKADVLLSLANLSSAEEIKSYLENYSENQRKKIFLLNAAGKQKSLEEIRLQLQSFLTSGERTDVSNIPIGDTNLRDKVDTARKEKLNKVNEVMNNFNAFTEIRELIDYLQSLSPTDRKAFFLKSVSGSEYSLQYILDSVILFQENKLKNNVPRIQLGETNLQEKIFNSYTSEVVAKLNSFSSGSEIVSYIDSITPVNREKIFLASKTRPYNLSEVRSRIMGFMRSGDEAEIPGIVIGGRNLREIVVSSFFEQQTSWREEALQHLFSSRNVPEMIDYLTRLQSETGKKNLVFLSVTGSPYTVDKLLSQLNEYEASQNPDWIPQILFGRTTLRTHIKNQL